MRAFVFIFLAVFLATPVVYAQEPESTVLDYKGKPGFWIPDATFTKMLQDLEELPLLRQKVELLELKVKQSEELALALKAELQVTEQISAKWKLAFDEQMKVTVEQRDHYEELLAQEKKWYRSPVLWFSVGVVLTTALAIGMNYGLAETR